MACNSPISTSSTILLKLMRKAYENPPEPDLCACRTAASATQTLKESYPPPSGLSRPHMGVVTTDSAGTSSTKRMYFFNRDTKPKSI